MVLLAQIILPPLQLNSQYLWRFCDAEALIGGGCVFDRMFRAATPLHVGHRQCLKTLDQLLTDNEISKHRRYCQVQDGGDGLLGTVSVLKLTVPSVLTSFIIGKQMIGRNSVRTDPFVHVRH